GLKALCEKVLGWLMEKPKQVTIGNWDKRVLEVEQVRYAYLDAYVSYELMVKTRELQNEVDTELVGNL
ncbi:hypothetical protein C1H46_037864, partial [Malus baccata]